jgi:hypothetical protein
MVPPKSIILKPGLIICPTEVSPKSKLVNLERTLFKLLSTRKYIKLNFL